jgi:hypothetical protein
MGRSRIASRAGLTEARFPEVSVFATVSTPWHLCGMVVPWPGFA